MKIALACGGTAGHIFPAIAFAQRATNYQLIFIGGNRFEKEIIPEYNFRFYQLKIVRKSIFKLIHSVWKAISILRHEKCQAVLATGGYATFPVILAALVLRIPYFLHEQNVLPGRLNRLVSIGANKVFVSFEESHKYFKNGIVTGNPVREEIADLSKTITPHYPPKKILIFGGSLGSSSLNQLAQELKKSPEYEIININSYTNKIIEYYQLVDFVICRAGATSIAEILSLGLPALYVPYPLAKDDHQTYNAEAIVKKNLGFTLQDNDLSVENVSNILTSSKIPGVIKQIAIYNKNNHEDKKILTMINEINQAIGKKEV